MICQKYTLALQFLFITGPLPFTNFVSNTGYGLPYFVTGGGGKTVCIPWRSAHDRYRICSSDFGWKMFIKSSINSISIFSNFLIYPFFHLFVSGMQFIPFSGIVCVYSRWGGSVPTGALLYCSDTSLAIFIAVKR